MIIKLMATLITLFSAVFVYVFLSDYNIVIKLLSIILYSFACFLFFYGFLEGLSEEIISHSSRKKIKYRILSLFLCIFISSIIFATCISLGLGKLLSFFLSLGLFIVLIEMVYNLFGVFYEDK